MNILITTDDGWKAEGFRLLVDIVKKMQLGTVCCVAPESNQSGCGSSVSLRKPIEVKGTPSMIRLVGGTPIDCLQWAFQGPDPELVLVGINNGANVGSNLLTSGTVCAAAWAAQRLVPAIAISQHWRKQRTFKFAGERLPFIIKACLELYESRGLDGAFFNVNLPDPADKYQEPIFADRGDGGYLRTFHKAGTELRPVQSFYSSGDLEIGGYALDDDLLQKGHATVTPLAHMRVGPKWQQWLGGMLKETSRVKEQFSGLGRA